LEGGGGGSATAVRSFRGTLMTRTPDSCGSSKKYAPKAFVSFDTGLFLRTHLNAEVTGFFASNPGSCLGLPMTRSSDD
jgi:hypothetical protein